MSLFQCYNCGCAENTALSSRGFTFTEFWDWTGKERLKGELLCSACGPKAYSDGTVDEDCGGYWHNRFPRRFYPTGELVTDKQGNLAVRDKPKEDISVYECVSTCISVIDGAIARDDSSDTNLSIWRLVDPLMRSVGSLDGACMSSADIRAMWNAGQLDRELAKFTDEQKRAVFGRWVLGKEHSYQELMSLLVGRVGFWQPYLFDYLKDLLPLTDAERQMCAPVVAKYDHLFQRPKN